ncbi:MAG: type II toxin-antitoxin system RelE/ParE family toxin [Nanoarchaeota archaeon]|nr:type II toxin-antitoxin system RelE/ParE family toxin [Nanoarchaeota archaeon]
MVYELNFTDNFRKQFSKLEKQLQQRIISALERIRIRPEYFAIILVGSPYYKLRIGDYRAILDIKKDKLLILLVEVGHRKNVYKN